MAQCRMSYAMRLSVSNKLNYRTRKIFPYKLWQRFKKNESR
jgi:hypothetical protein